MNETLLTTPKFSVERRTIASTNGKTIRREVVVHPGAVVILPILDDGRIVMIRNYRYGVGRELLELPAGTRDEGEEPLQTAHRELEEETGYRANTMTLLASFFTSPGILTERMYAFLAEGLTQVGAKPEETERITVDIQSEETMRRMLRNGELEDGKSMAVLGMYFAFKQSGETKRS